MCLPASSTQPADPYAALLHVAKALSSEVRQDRLLRVIVEQATAVLDAERSSLFLYDATRDELRSVVAQGMPFDEISFSADHGLAGYVARTRMPLVLSDAYADPRFNRAIDAWTGYRTRTVLCLPVIDRAQRLIGVLQVLNKKGGKPFTEADERLLEAFCAHAALALERAVLVEAYAEQQRLQEAIRVAGDMQRSLLPDPEPIFPGWADLSAHLAPAWRVGGDLYDFFRIDDRRLGVAVGDVSGHGVPAALHMAGTQAALRAIGLEGHTPGYCLDHVRRAQRGGAETFVTLCYGVLDVPTGRFDYVNAGHPPPLRVRASGRVDALRKGDNPPVCRLWKRPFNARSTRLRPGDLILLYTDGVLEATDAKGRQYGEARLRAVLRRHAHATPAALVQALRSELRAFIGDALQRDDVTLLALRYRGASAHVPFETA